MIDLFKQELNDYSFLVPDIKENRFRKKRKGSNKKICRNVVVSGKDLYDVAMNVFQEKIGL